MSEARPIAFCPHCGNTSPQTLVHTEQAIGRAWIIGSKEEVQLECTFFVAVCDVCHHPLVYGVDESQPEPDVFTDANLLYPDAGRLERSVPASVAAAYEEAFRIRRVAPNAFAVLIRRALEALCHDRGAEGTSLARGLKSLAERGEIPPTLAEMTDVLRLIGNVGAHAGSAEVLPYQVFAVDKFFRAVVEYVYVAPSRLAEFRRRLATFSADSAHQEGEAA